MKLSGTVDVNGYHCKFTSEGDWAISYHGTFVGHAETLAGVQDTIDANLDTVRARLRLALDRDEQNKLETI